MQESGYCLDSYIFVNRFKKSVLFLFLIQFFHLLSQQNKKTNKKRKKCYFMYRMNKKHKKGCNFL